MLSHDLNSDHEIPDSGTFAGTTGNIFLHSLPIAGKDGTLEKRMCQDFVTGKVIAKTGSISGVSTLSGYVLLPEDTLVFSIMMQNFIPGDGDTMRALQDSICTMLAFTTIMKEYSRAISESTMSEHYGATWKRPSCEHEPDMAEQTRKIHDG